jgi:hypothetical protein
MSRSNFSELTNSQFSQLRSLAEARLAYDLAPPPPHPPLSVP